MDGGGKYDEDLSSRGETVLEERVELRQDFGGCGIGAIGGERPVEDASGGVESEEVRAYLYEQRNNQDLFFQKGEYAQSGCDEVMMTEEDANRSLIIQPEMMSDGDDEAPAPIDKDLYLYDSDHGETSFYSPPRRRRRNVTSPTRTYGNEEEMSRAGRRPTLPSENAYRLPTTNAWQ